MSLKWDNSYASAYYIRGISKIKLGFEDSGWADINMAGKLGMVIDIERIKKVMK